MSNFFQAVGDSIRDATCQNPGVATFVSQYIPSIGVVAGGIATGATAGAAAPGAAAAVLGTAAVGAAISGVLASCPSALPDDPNPPPFPGGQCCDGNYRYTAVIPSVTIDQLNYPGSTRTVSGVGRWITVEPVAGRGSLGSRATGLRWKRVGCDGSEFEGISGPVATVVSGVGGQISVERLDSGTEDCGDPPPSVAPRPSPINISPTYNYGDNVVNNDFSFRPSLNPQTTLNLDGSVSARFELDLSDNSSFEPSLEIEVNFNPDGTTSTRPIGQPRPPENLPPDTIEPGDGVIIPELSEAYEIGGVEFSTVLPEWSGKVAGTSPAVTPQVLANFRWFYESGPGPVSQIRQSSGTIAAPVSRLGRVVGFLLEPVEPYVFQTEIIAVEVTDGR